MSRSSAISSSRRRSGAPVGQIYHQKTWDDGPENGNGWGSQDADNFVATGQYPTCTDPNNCYVSNYRRGQVTRESGLEADRGSWYGKVVVPNATDRRSAESLYSRTILHRDEYYCHALKLSDYNWEGSFGQYNYQGVSGSPFFLSGSQFTNPTTRVQDKAHSSIFAIVNGGDVSSRADGAPPYMSGQPRGAGYTSRGMPTPGPYYYFEQDTIDTDVWLEMITHHYWTHLLDGVCEGWARVKGQPWAKKFSISGGFPTVQWGRNGWNFPTSYGWGTNDKIGLYTEASGQTTTIYEDMFACCSTLEAAMAFFG